MWYVHKTGTHMWYVDNTRTHMLKWTRQEHTHKNTHGKWTTCIICGQHRNTYVERRKKKIHTLCGQDRNSHVARERTQEHTCDEGRRQEHACGMQIREEHMWFVDKTGTHM